MSALQALVLGLLQGATEFIPVSSSGHLVLIPWLLSWEAPGLTYDTIVHLGTLIAVLFYFRSEVIALWRGWWGSLLTRKIDGDEARLAWLLLISSLPGALAGYFWGDFFEGLFSSPRAVALFLLVTGALLTTSERLTRRKIDLGKLDVAKTLMIGLAQALAIAPGLSRSGATISTGLLCGLGRESAARFSFLMAIPIIAGAAGAQLFKAASAGIGTSEILTLAIGFWAALCSGYIAIRFMLNHLRVRSLRPFAYYCFAFGFLVLIISVGR